jgi:YebC/PmpR family DNA-binding regulatory protein
VDAKRGKVFTKLIRDLTIAARGGGDPDANPSLRTCIAKAKDSNMPADTIKRAIQRGTGELPGVNYEEFTLEGYGPGGTGILLEIMTDNRNRTVSEVRHLFSKYNGSMAESGAVAWVFEQKGLISVPKEGVEEEEIMLVALDAGAEDIAEEENVYEVYASLPDFESVRKAVEEAGIEIERAELTRVPQNTVPVEGKTAQQLLALMEMLEDNDDVQRVYANFEIDDKELAVLTA